MEEVGTQLLDSLVVDMHWRVTGASGSLSDVIQNEFAFVKRTPKPKGELKGKYDLPSNYLWVPGKVPGLNEMLDQRMRIFGSNHSGTRVANGYSKLKREYSQRVRLYLMQQDFEKAPKPCWMSYMVVEKSKARDPSNIWAGAMKMIEDAITGPVLDNDGWDEIAGVALWCEVSPVDGVLVSWGPTLASREEMQGVYVRGIAKCLEAERPTPVHGTSKPEKGNGG